MKKRAMKKWIPKGVYCHGNGTKKYPHCKWRRYITTIKRDKTNCDFAETCYEECWTKPDNSCRDIVYRCEFLKFTDFKQDSLLWDTCKECGVKENYE